ncbi:MAG TPA: glycosyltransferase family 4 protein [Bryobacteraceae bacterium]|nr:glycosyltransferase family 4 protein [Bryobacteraceae bacterium]
MRILILNQSFYPDIVSAAQHASDLASALVEEGHAVTVVASRRAYTDRHTCFPARETWRGCDVRRVFSLGLEKTGKWGRILDSAILLAAFLRELIRLPRFDVVLAMTHPPMVAFLAALITRIKGGRLVSWVMDLNPDEAIAAGWLRAESLAARVLNWALVSSLRASLMIVVLDRFMLARIEGKGIPPENIVVIPPWAHDKTVRYDAAGRAEFRAAHGLADKFVVMYSGNLSPVHPLDTLLHAAARLGNRNDIRFCFIGGGNALPAVQQFFQERHLETLVCLPYQPLSRLGASLSAADLHLVTMGDSMVGIVHPCKIYSILTLGVPFLHIGPGENHLSEIAKSLGTPGASYHARHGDIDGVVNAIVEAASRNPGTVEELRRASAPFSQGVLIPKFIRILEEVVAEERPHMAVHLTGEQAE